MPRPEIITHLIRIRRQDPGYYKWAAPRYEALDMPGLVEEVEEVEARWAALTEAERMAPWAHKTKSQPTNARPDGLSRTEGNHAGGR